MSEAKVWDDKTVQIDAGRIARKNNKINIREYCAQRVSETKLRTVEQREHQIKRLQIEREQELAHKDAEIATLSKNIEEMSNKFTEMLRETLRKMHDRIELANNQMDNEKDSTNLERIQEITSMNKWYSNRAYQFFSRYLPVSVRIKRPH